MPPEQQKIVLTWSTIIAIVGMCVPILIFQASNHKEEMAAIRETQDSVLVDRRDYQNHICNEDAINSRQEKRIDELEKNQKHYYATAKQN